jgi:hypothetical protein
MDASLGQGALVSCSPLAFGAIGGSEALVSRSATLLTALMFAGSLAGGALALLPFISLYCGAPITRQMCLTFLPLTLVLKPHRNKLA